MKVTRILHHSVQVEGSLAPAVDFYRSLFELADANRPDIPGVSGHWLALQGAQIHLVDAPLGDGPIQPTGPHECFGVEDLALAIEELETRGIPYQRGQQGEVIQIWITDPFGNTLELQQDPMVAPSH